jgi:hypothetical protein
MSRGRTTACSRESRKTPSVSDALHIKAMVLTGMGRVQFTSQVGAESNVQCIKGMPGLTRPGRGCVYAGKEEGPVKEGPRRGGSR